MAGAKETPRQKMIGMMYLVLMALLAMNVSKEVLLSFVVINNAMEKTNEALAGQNALTMNEFDKQYGLNPEKVRQWYDKAKIVEQEAEGIVDHIEKLKQVLIAMTEVGGKDYESAIERYKESKVSDGIHPDSVWNLQLVGKKDSYDAPTNIMIGAEPGKPKEGEFTAVELREMLQSFEANVKKTLPPNDAKNYDPGFDFGPVRVARDEVQEWEAGNFYHLPLAAVITNLTRYQANVKKAESDALKILMSNISAEDFKFDKIAVKVIPNSNYVVIGDSFKADVIVAAYSTTENPELEVGKDIDTSGMMDEWSVVNPDPNEERIKVENGVAQYGYKVASEGEVEWGGFVKIRKPGSDERVKYPFRHKFIAAKPSTVVSPTKMNVVYRGLDNPIDISVAGFSATKVKASATNGSLRQVGPGKYELKPGNGNISKVSVSVETEDGTRQMGEPFEFRVKNIPKPEPYFAGQTGTGALPSGALRQATGVQAILKDFDFEGVKYNVVEFTINVNKGGRITNLKANGSKLTGEQKGLLANLGRGDQLNVRNIWAIGPDGVRKSLSPIVLDIR